MCRSVRVRFEEKYMLSAILWFATITGFSVLTALAIGASRWIATEPQGTRRWARLLGGIVIACVTLTAVALLLRIPQFAELDATVVRNMTDDRSAGLVSLFTTVTTMGDVVPCYVIACSLALWYYLTVAKSPLVLILPLVIIVEIGIQFAMAHAFGDPSLSTVRAGINIGGSGPLPSGSTARLFSVFTIASAMWATTESNVSPRILATGGVLVVVELTSRLYLGRHFVTDIVAGLLLGLLLATAGLFALRGLSSRATDDVHATG